MGGSWVVATRTDTKLDGGRSSLRVEGPAPVAIPAAAAGILGEIIRAYLAAHDLRATVELGGENGPMSTRPPGLACAAYIRTSTDDQQSPEDSKRWQLDTATRLVAPAGGAISPPTTPST